MADASSVAATPPSPHVESYGHSTASSLPALPDAPPLRVTAADDVVAAASAAGPESMRAAEEAAAATATAASSSTPVSEGRDAAGVPSPSAAAVETRSGGGEHAAADAAPQAAALAANPTQEAAEGGAAAGSSEPQGEAAVGARSRDAGTRAGAEVEERSAEASPPPAAAVEAAAAVSAASPVAVQTTPASVAQAPLAVQPEAQAADDGARVLEGDEVQSLVTDVPLNQEGREASVAATQRTSAAAKEPVDAREAVALPQQSAPTVARRPSVQSHAEPTPVPVLEVGEQPQSAAAEPVASESVTRATVRTAAPGVEDQPTTQTPPGQEALPPVSRSETVAQQPAASAETAEAVQRQPQPQPQQPPSASRPAEQLVTEERETPAVNRIPAQGAASTPPARQAARTTEGSPPAEEPAEPQAAPALPTQGAPDKQAHAQSAPPPQHPPAATQPTGQTEPQQQNPVSDADPRDVSPAAAAPPASSAAAPVENSSAAPGGEPIPAAPATAAGLSVTPQPTAAAAAVAAAPQPVETRRPEGGGAPLEQHPPRPVSDVSAVPPVEAAQTPRVPAAAEMASTDAAQGEPSSAPRYEQPAAQREAERLPQQQSGSASHPPPPPPPPAAQQQPATSSVPPPQPTAAESEPAEHQTAPAASSQDGPMLQAAVDGSAPARTAGSLPAEAAAAPPPEETMMTMSSPARQQEDTQPPPTRPLPPPPPPSSHELPGPQQGTATQPQARQATGSDGDGDNDSDDACAATQPVRAADTSDAAAANTARAVALQLHTALRGAGAPGVADEAAVFAALGVVAGSQQLWAAVRGQFRRRHRACHGGDLVAGLRAALHPPALARCDGILGAAASATSPRLAAAKPPPPPPDVLDLRESCGGVPQKAPAAMPWTIPPPQRHAGATKAMAASWKRATAAAPLDFGAFVPLPTGDGEEERARRRQLFDVLDVTGSKRLSLAEITRGVRDVLQLEEVFGDCRYAVMAAFRAGAEEAADGLVPRRGFRRVLRVLDAYVGAYALFHSMTVGDTVTRQAFCGSAHFLRSRGLVLPDPEAAFRAAARGGDVIGFADFCDWAVAGGGGGGSGGRDDSASPDNADAPPSPYQQPAAAPRQGRQPSPPCATRFVPSGINRGCGGGDWAVRFYQGAEALGSLGPIDAVHRLLEEEAEDGAVREGCYSVLLPHVAEALFPVGSSLAVSRSGHVRKMIGQAYAQTLYADADVRRLFLTSYDRTLACLGVCVDLHSGACSNSGGRFHLLVSRRGTAFRKLVTRVLHALGTFGLDHFRAPLLALLVEEVAASPGVAEGCREACRVQWIPVLPEGRQKDLLFARLHASESAAAAAAGGVGRGRSRGGAPSSEAARKRGAAGSGVCAARRGRKMSPPPLAARSRSRSPPPVAAAAAAVAAPQQQRERPRSRSCSPPRRAAPFQQQRVPTPEAFAPPPPPPPPPPAAPSHEVLAAAGAAAATGGSVGGAGSRPMSPWENLSAHPEAHLPIRLEEYGECYRLVVLGCPDRVRLLVHLLALQVRVVPPTPQQQQAPQDGSGRVLIDDLEDYVEAATRHVQLACPVDPASTRKEAWGTRHTVFTVQKLSDSFAEV